MPKSHNFRSTPGSAASVAAQEMQAAARAILAQVIRPFAAQVTLAEMHAIPAEAYAAVGLISTSAEAVQDALERLSAARPMASHSDLRRALEAAGRLATLACADSTTRPVLARVWGGIWPTKIDGEFFSDPLYKAPKKPKLWGAVSYSDTISMKVLGACGAQNALENYQILCGFVHVGRVSAAMGLRVMVHAQEDPELRNLRFGGRDRLNVDPAYLLAIEVIETVRIAYRCWEDPSRRPSESELSAAATLKTPDERIPVEPPPGVQMTSSPGLPVQDRE